MVARAIMDRGAWIEKNENASENENEEETGVLGPMDQWDHTSEKSSHGKGSGRLCGRKRTGDGEGVNGILEQDWNLITCARGSKWNQTKKKQD